MKDIRLIVFDLDGVLVSTKDLHYEALNRALGKKYAISYDEHIKTYDGNPTSFKLEMLTVNKGLPREMHEEINTAKQLFTKQMLAETTEYNAALVETFRKLDDSYILWVASNSIRSTVDIVVEKLGIAYYVDGRISNEDVKQPKPAVEMYLKAMIACDASPRQTVILEDSYLGRKAAQRSGAHLLAIRTPEDVTYERITNFIEDTPSKKTIWHGGNMNVVIPMAGAGTRFADAGYTFPKPLIDVNGIPMIQAVVENLAIKARYIFIVQEEHDEKYNLTCMLNMIAPGCEIIRINGITEGAACTVLKAVRLIDNNEELIIANSDQIMGWDSSEFMYKMQKDSVDGGIVTFENTHPKWSYAKVDEYGFVTEVAEKKPISTHATTGVYYWKKGRDFVFSAKRMIKNDTRVNGEFYVAPVFNEAIAKQKHIVIHEIEKMHGVGTPEDLNNYLRTL